MSIALSSIPVFAAAVAEARSVDFTAYTLRPGVVREALLKAARAGAHIRVRLERDPLDDPARTLHAANAEALTLLVAAGADAACTAPGDAVLHLKAAVVDGVAWLDDRNWAGAVHETVVRDSEPADIDALHAALDGVGGSGVKGHLGTTKGASLDLETDLIHGAGDVPLDLESESFGSGPIYNALLRRAKAGWPTRLLVAAREAREAGPAGDRERRRLGKLASLGVEVRTGKSGGADLDEKLAVVGSAAWVGSANATYARGTAADQRDWGLVTQKPALVGGLRAAFSRNWSAGQPLNPGPVVRSTTARTSNLP